MPRLAFYPMKIKRPAQKYNSGFSEWVQGAANDASACAESVFYVAWEAMNWPIGHFEQGRDLALCLARLFL